MVVFFERRNGRVVFDIVKGSEVEERLFHKLFKKHGSEIVRSVPLGTPLDFDVFKLKKILEGRRKCSGLRR